tara:strand:- start:1884 stop:2336 length:453 start_codon:yes stop_codon:yes gene_type:complete
MKKDFAVQSVFLGIILLIILLGPYIYNYFNHEGFANFLSPGVSNYLSPGNYPLNDDVPLLNNDYPLKKNPHLNPNNPSPQKVFPSSYKQETNNKRYWKLPTDGTCSPYDLCNTLYEKKNIKIPKQPPAIPFSDPRTRINYYTTCTDQFVA